MSTPNAREGLQAVGINSILPKEHGSQFVALPLIKAYTELENVSVMIEYYSIATIAPKYLHTLYLTYFLFCYSYFLLLTLCMFAC